MVDDTFDIGDGIEQAACHQCGHVVDVSSAAPFSIVACTHCGAKLAVPARLGDFLLLKVLGKGTMGAAYKAFDRALSRQVAIKVMRRSLGQDEQLVDRFLGEARALAALNHRNVVQIYSLGKEKGRPYIVMELAGGGALRDRMRSSARLSEAEVLDIGIQVAEGLKAANGIGLIHGDVKPANILFGEDGSAKLVDFGLARFGGVRAEPGEGLGTPYYVAPERVRQQAADHRADIYSLGATLFHALAGEPPFEGPTVKDVLAARLKGPAPSLRTVGGAITPQTCGIAAKMLAADPAERYQNYDELLAALREAARALPARTPPPGAAPVSDLAHLQQSLAGSGSPAGALPGAPAGSPVVHPAEVLRPVYAPAPAAGRPSNVLSRPQARELNVVVLILVAGGVLLLIAGLVFGVWLLSRDSSTPGRGNDEGTSSESPGDPRRPAPAIVSPHNPVSQPRSPDVPPVPPEGQPTGIRVSLKARDADIQGIGAVYESAKDKDCIGQWHGKDIAVGWQFELNRTGSYTVEVVYACMKEHAGGNFSVEIGDRTLPGHVEDTGGWTSFATTQLGKVTLADPGLYTVIVKGTPNAGKSLMNLRAVNLIPAK